MSESEEIVRLRRQLAAYQAQTDELQKQTDELQKQTRNTTLEEYLRGCHSHLQQALRVQDARFGTQGSTTSTKGRLCPKFLKPWTEFPTKHHELFKRVCECVPSDGRYFPNVTSLAEQGRMLGIIPLASEKDLEFFERIAVNIPVAYIHQQLQETATAVKYEGRWKGKITFENHANSLNDQNSEVQESLKGQTTLPNGQSPIPYPKPQDSDSICIYHASEGQKRAVLIVEYKPPHKLKVEHLICGLERADKGSLNVHDDVIDQDQIPTDNDGKFIYHSEKMTIAALIQTYDYMVHTGLQYSKMSTGEADVLVCIKEDEPDTLFYHLTSYQTETNDEGDSFPIYCTAVAQTLTLCLMALASENYTQEWRTRTTENGRSADFDYETYLDNISKEDKALTPPSSAYKAHSSTFIRTPVQTRARKNQAKRGCGPALSKNQKSGDSDHSDDESQHPATPTPKGTTRHTGQSSSTSRLTKKSSSSKSQPGRDTNVRKREFCTQACLLGLVRGGPMNEACPNFEEHRVHGRDKRHPFGRSTFKKLLQAQLYEDRDHGCDPLGVQGACGAIFRLTLLSHGYTVVGKGTVLAYNDKLKHEGKVYRHLEKLQGDVIPVYLGNISLSRCYFLDFGVKIIHMLLMSWIGEPACARVMSAIGRDLSTERSEAVLKLLNRGVDHRDVREPNVLWSAETKKVVLIDFERSGLDISRRSQLREKEGLQNLLYKSPDTKRPLLDKENDVLRYGPKKISLG